MKKLYACLGAVLLITVQAAFAQGSWNTLTSPTNHDLWGVFFLDDLNGWVVGDSGTILKTTNGGQTWDTPVTPAGTENINLRDVIFIDQNVGYIAGEYKCLKSTDGGGHWFWLTDPASDAVAAKGNRLAYIQTSEVYTSTDQGATTTQHINVSSNNTLLRDIDMLDSITLIVSGAVGGIFRSTDFGNTWTDVSHGTEQVYEMDFLDATTGWFCATGGKIAKTTDGGQTWTDLATLTGFQWFYDIDFPDASTGFVVGDWKGLLKSTDGGQTWARETINGADTSVETWRGVHALRADYAFAVGDSGAIVRLGVPAGIPKPLIAEKLVVAPNPSTGAFQLELPGSSSRWDIRVMDLSGKVLASYTVQPSGTLTVNTHLSNGQYLLEAVSGSTRLITKFLIVQ